VKAGTTSARGERQTEQRRTLLTFLARADRCLSAQEIHAELHRQGSAISLATVYRTVARLARSGVVDVLMRDDGEATYIQGSGRHHHHLVCRSCGRVVEISEPTVESWTREVAKKYGFSDASHELTVYGVCQPCRPSPTHDA
jgi:Fur family ferric uptake transcriptional regulator